MADPAVIHSVLSFSGRERWRKCPASVRMSAGLPDKSGPSAAEGAIAHAVKEYAVKQWQARATPSFAHHAPPPGLDVPNGDVEAWNVAMFRHAQEYVRFIRTLTETYPDAIVLEEQKVDARSIHPQLFGTADTIIWIPSIGRLIVIDYKYGFRVVDIGTADDTNPQLAAYGVAAAEQITKAGQEVREIVLGVYQPRVPLRDPAQLLTIPNAQKWLLDERAKLYLEAGATEAPDAPLKPGDHCRYCKAAAAGKCPAVKTFTATALNVAAGELALLDIPTDELLALYSARSAFKPFLEEIEERIAQLAKVGHARLTIKESQGRQMWADPKTAALTLMALGRTDLLQPVSLSDALPAMPADVAASLTKRSKPSVTIKVVDAPAVKEVAKIFDKYAKIA